MGANESHPNQFGYVLQVHFEHKPIQKLFFQIRVLDVVLVVSFFSAQQQTGRALSPGSIHWCPGTQKE